MFNRIYNLVAVLCLVLLTTVSVPIVSAQEVETTDLVVVAQVSVYDASITQEGHMATASFTLTNGADTVQPDIKYGLELWSASADTSQPSTRVYTGVAEETLALAGNETLSRAFSVQLPSALSGIYTARIVAETTSGLPLGSTRAGTIRLEGEEGVVIDQSSCYVYVDDDDTPYSTHQGVDIAEEESLMMTCTVTNPGSAISLVPVYTTTERSLYGDVVETITGEARTFDSGAYPVTFTIPTPDTPQAYDTTVTLYDGQIPVSTTASLHYVVQGRSATIQNVTLDKTEYQAGDIARASLFISGIAGAFPDARNQSEALANPVVVATLTSGAGVACADTASVSLAELESSDVAFTDISFDVTHTCPNATVSLEVQDDQGTLVSHVAHTDTARFETTETVSVLAIILLVIVAGGVIYLVTRANTKVTASAVLILVVGFAGAGLVFGGGSGTTGPGGSPGGTGSGWGWGGWGWDTYEYGKIMKPASFTGVAKFETVTVTVTGSLDKKEYIQGENVVLNSSIKVSLCQNDWLDGSIAWSFDDETQKVEFFTVRCLSQIEMDIANKKCDSYKGDYDDDEGTAPLCDRIEKNKGERCIPQGGVGTRPAPAPGDHVANIFFEGKHGEVFNLEDALDYEMKKILKTSGELYFTVTTPPAPTVSLTAQPNIVYEGDDTTLIWTPANVTSCVASSNPTISGWEGGVTADMQDSVIVGPLTEDIHLFTVTCMNDENEFVEDSVQVFVEEKNLPECSDSADNDGDGWVDLEDLGCYTDGIYNPRDDDETNIDYDCSDGSDNDGDNQIDGYDPGCDNAFDDDEFNEVPESLPDDRDDDSGDPGDGNDDDVDPDEIDFSEF